MKVFNSIRKVIFLLSASFIVIAIYSLTIGQGISIEFQDWHFMHDYYDFIMEALPLALVLTLTGTLKFKRSNVERFIIVCVTIVTSIMSFFWAGVLAFRIGFGAWVDVEILYEYRDDRNIKIKEQIYDVGALGYGGTRTVKLTPFLKFWYRITHVDSTKITKTEWITINKELIIY